MGLFLCSSLFADTRVKRQLRVGSRINNSTTGGVLYTDSNNKLAQDASDLFWDDTDDELGVGTGTANQEIDVHAVDPEIRLTDTGDSEYTRITRADTSKKAQRFNRVTKPGTTISGLVGHWKMNDNAANTTVTDSSSSGDDGTFTDAGGDPNTDAHSVTGKINEALDFDGSDDYIDISGTSALTNYTISLWINPDSTTDNNYISDFSGNNESALIIGFQDGNYNLFGGSYPTGTASDSQMAITGVGSWDLVTWVKSGTNLKGYVNSVEQVDVTISSGDFVPSAGLRIGRNFSAGTANFDGQLDDYRIYNKALIQSEIDTIYNSGSGLDGNTSASSVVEASVWSSEDGVNEGEEGIQTYGDGAGRTVIDGKTTRFNINSSEIANIDANGFLMIGSSAEAESLLHIISTGDAQITLDADTDNSGENDNARIELRQDGNAVIGGLGFVGDAGEIFTGSLENALYLVNDFSSTLQFGTNDITRATIDNNGLFGIGVTAPATLLEVENGLSTTGVQISNTATDGDPYYSLALSGTLNWLHGIDDGDGDKQKFGTSTAWSAPWMTVDPTTLNIGIHTTTPGFDVDMGEGAFGNFGRILMKSAVEHTISSGAITITEGHIRVDTESDAANDDLDTITSTGGGEILFLLAEDDARTVRLRHAVGNIFLKHQVETKSYSFSSPAGSSGTFYAAGQYFWPTADANLTQASLSVVLGTANTSYAAHASIVAGGAGVVDTGVVKLTAAGTTMDDEGNRSASQTVDLVADITTLSTDDYVETSEKFIGQVTYALATASGSPVNFSLDFNYGFSKYEDFGNQDFTTSGLEVVGLAGANDTGFNIRLFHHSSTGWTYAASGFVPGGTVLANMNTDHSTEQDLTNGEPFAYKRTDLNTDISGNNGGGVVVEVTTAANKAVEIMDLHIGVHTAPKFTYLADTKQHLIFMKHGANWLEL